MAIVNITVTVDASTNPVTVSCNPSTELIGTSNAAVNIFWAMGSDSTSQEYHISNLTGLPTTEFVQQGSNGNGWKATDNNDTTDSYSYTVAVTHNATGETVLHDPTITNGGRS